MLLATVNQPITLAMLASDGNTALYGQARLYDSTGAFVTTINLSPVATEGLYQASYTPLLEGYFSIIYQFFLDAPRTVDAGYDRQGETLDVSSFRTDILRMLGLQHENTVVDLQTYDGDQNLLSARIRSYTNASDASAAYAVSPAAYNTNLLFEWTVSAAYTAGNLSKYEINRVL